MTGRAALPLGIDIGSTRVRMVQAVRIPGGGIRLCAAAARDIPSGVIERESIVQPELLAAVLEEMRGEMTSSFRNCVIALTPQAGTLRIVRFPKMGWAERRRAALFEAERFVAPIEGIRTLVRTHALRESPGFYAIGTVSEDVLRSRVACLKLAGLKPVAVDAEACAAARAFPHADAVLDVGANRSTLHVRSQSGPVSLCVPEGGGEITRAIGGDLGIDITMAERRKRILGTAGAGEPARQAYAGRVEAMVSKARERAPVRRIALTGNGARLPGLCEVLESVTQALVEIPVSDLLRDGAYPDDVVRAAAPDWTLAASLAAWSTLAA